MPPSSHPSITNIQEEIRTLLPKMTPSQTRVLGEMVYAMLMIDGCGMTRMCSFLSELFGKSMNTLRHKYREIYYEAEAKAGVKKRQRKRREIVVEDHFADLLQGVLRQWQGPKILVLALDGSTLSDRLDVLSISVVTRGCGIRVAWTILQGHQEGEWRPHWERMLAQLRGAVPAEWQVVVMADRGLYAAWLFEAIQANGWHPFLRVKKNLSFRQDGETHFGLIGQRVKRAGRRWKGRGEWGQKGVLMRGTVLIRWEAGYEEPIAVVTDLEPERAQAAWYQMRFWIEDEYKDGKRGWFHWEQTKMTRPSRASRLWLVLSIALQKAILLGSELEAREQEQQARGRKKQAGGPPRRRGRPSTPQQRPRGREQSVLMRGVMALRAAESGGARVLPQGQLRTEPLPTRLYPVTRVYKSYQHKKQRRAERKRNRQRAQNTRRRAERAAIRAAEQATREARRQEKQERRAERVAVRAAEQAAREARRQEKQERQAAKEAALLASRQERQQQRAARQAMHQANGGVAHRAPDKLINQRPVLECPAEAPRLPASDDQWQASDLPDAPGSRLPVARIRDKPPREEPLLRLFRGRLQPPHRLLHKKILRKSDHEPAQEAGP